MTQESGATQGEHTTPVLVFDLEGGERLVTRAGRVGELGLFMHSIPGAAVFTLPPGIDRPLDSDDLSLAAKHLRQYANNRGELATPILACDGQPLDLGPQVEMTMPEPVAGYRFEWGDQSCALLVTTMADPVMNVTAGRVYTYDHSWVDPEPTTVSRLLGRFFR